ncbi:hypothetical protein A3C91_03045 [Candidatus Azambacteria bacterium RIFCSPHIGHO2_02_FULL_52_12]|uniref:Uncharacterized protein n=1 Tax=Candidatus Azambacteria bacterium RIFCSPLOWO2_01_FULL_46_25 TaxID=1797298 RepID=A0A1F5BT38_9BACT|nr:MAG: hypothetical protein A3C91_03045 [Candidatus Azambacteria bacterium RIFCSPHIGHO2_02_FULL_52_12]OGD33810.1 MAG: hypothetical protein A2988_01910 [Candidatus Azambacteria bacterium RIFCSPLOWO2_01_FULL_46_25]OGD36814.1 MAG: hypothetical protein A2850_02460 [Candidatus Azambacteria bacterium RIFCSPHIGHO2_01_FULL_51_74]
MSIERPYIPSKEEHQRALDSLTEEYRKLGMEREKDSEAKVIEALTAKGKNSPEAMSVLGNWIEMKQHEVDLINTSRASVELAMKAAWIYKQSGHFNEALEELRTTEEAAWNEDEALYYMVIALKMVIENANRENEEYDDQGEA